MLTTSHNAATLHDKLAHIEAKVSEAFSSPHTAQCPHERVLRKLFPQLASDLSKWCHDEALLRDPVARKHLTSILYTMAMSREPRASYGFRASLWFQSRLRTLCGTADEADVLTSTAALATGLPEWVIQHEAPPLRLERRQAKPVTVSTWPSLSLHSAANARKQDDLSWEACTQSVYTDVVAANSGMDVVEAICRDEWDTDNGQVHFWLARPAAFRDHLLSLVNLDEDADTSSSSCGTITTAITTVSQAMFHHPSLHAFGMQVIDALLCASDGDERVLVFASSLQTQFLDCIHSSRAPQRLHHVALGLDAFYPPVYRELVIVVSSSPPTWPEVLSVGQAEYILRAISRATGGALDPHSRAFLELWLFLARFSQWREAVVASLAFPVHLVRGHVSTQADVLSAFLGGDTTLTRKALTRAIKVLRGSLSTPTDDSAPDTIRLYLTRIGSIVAPHSAVYSALILLLSHHACRRPHFRTALLSTLEAHPIS